MGAKKLEGICLPAFGYCQQLRMVCGLVHISECNRLTIKSSLEIRGIGRKEGEVQDGKEGAKKQASVGTPRQKV